jgi:DNA-directed RNA polymerase specialized sigma24 family protein
MQAIGQHLLHPLVLTAWVALAFGVALAVAAPWVGIAGFAPLMLAARAGRGPERTDDAIDERLVAAYQAGDRSALDALHERYFDRIRACAHVTVREADDPDFVARRVFMRVASGLARLDPRRPLSFRVWLFRLARRTMLEARTAHLRGPEPARSAAFEETVAGWIADGEAHALREEFSPSECSALALCYVLDLSLDELAEGLGRTPQAVRELTARAELAYGCRAV